ncbi:MAG: methylated-DNA-[protein]-cysteine S-methyltransferase [Solirubrobacterales bacterium]|jgi:methylated-DNA-[protein]-cysteine S-methyltransferase|nr:methylated-DNA-[protein]-cysteine S-methyltransferase [Solirubrobacterales bacterium]
MSKRKTRASAADPAKAIRAGLGDVDELAAAAAGRLTDAAADAGLLDVAYATVDSPFGPFVVAATRRGLVRLAFTNERPDDVLEQLAARISPRLLEAPARLDQTRRELELYFEGKLHDFDLPLDWQLTEGFRRRVLRATARVPYGETSTYAEIAAKAGSERAFRAAGSALGSNPLPIVVPCHRILRSGGNLGGYGGGLPMKQRLLELEGVL